MTEDLMIDPRLWVGDDLDARLRHHFVDMRTTQGFTEFIDEKREKDPTAAFIGWRRIYDRFGSPVLVAVVVWKGEERKWRFPLLNSFVAPDNALTHLVFEALLKRIGLDIGLVVRQDMFEAFPGISFVPPAK